MKKKVIISISLIVSIVSIFFLLWYVNRWVEVPVGVFIGEKSDIEGVKQSILTYIGNDVKRMSEDPNAPPKEFVEKFLNEDLPFMKEYIIGVEIKGNKALATLGSDISHYGTRFYKLSKKEGEWKVEGCFYFRDLPRKEREKLRKKLDEIAGRLTKLSPDQVVYSFLSTNFKINDSGLAIIEEKTETECKVKVPLKDGRIAQFLLTRGTQDIYSIRPWEVKEYEFVKP